VASQRAKVFVVDDDDSVRQAFQRLLCAADFDARTFASAEALLAHGAALKAACVVSDLILPGMSGLELLAELRARGCRSPFILITAFDVPGQRDEAARRGAAAYLVKPFRGTTLLDAIRAWLEPARSP
jgi:FixJ family two-component response regulator